MQVMINVTLEGVKDECASNEILEASFFFIRELLPKCRKLEVNIFFDAIGSYDAFVEKLEDRHYEIYVNPRRKKTRQMIFLAHEFVHIKQYVLNEMSDGDNGIIWKGDLYEQDKQYDVIPWEDEAYTREEELYNKWIKLRS